MAKPLIWMVVVACMTWGMYSAGCDAENGVAEKQFRGRRAGVGMLFQAIGRSLGSTGSLVLGGAIELACVGWLVSAVKNGGDE